MILSKTCDYGLRATLYIAMQKNLKYVSIREISDNLEISFHFLTKILQLLTQQQLLTSFRGPKGGVSLAIPAENISLRDIIHAIDGPDLFEACILGLNKCGDDNPCPLHHEWKEIRSEVGDLFRKTSLKSLADKITADGLLLTNIEEVIRQ